MRKENILLAGVWFGPKKPNMTLLLEPELKELQSLFYTGVQVNISGVTKTVHAKLLLSLFDLPAKAAVVNMKQFNGRYGCLYCTNPGTSIAPGCSVYLPSDQQGTIERTHTLMMSWASNAEDENKAIYGVKGHSVLSFYTDIVNCVAIDYMHSILEGVTKYFTCMWLTSKHRHSCFYLGKKAKEVDKVLMQFKPPGQIHRSPRSISNIKLWKAAELRAWLLYYSIPILQHFLPSEYIHHWSLLVFSVHLLLSKEITQNDIEVYESALRTFYERVPDLYGDTACTANVDSVIHLTRMVKLWGPLWTHSLFGFENMNGHIRKLFHGTRQILDQLVFYVTAHRSLYYQSKMLTSEHEKNYFSFSSNHILQDAQFEGKRSKVSLSNTLHAVVRNFVKQDIINSHILSSKYRKGCTLYSSHFFSQEKAGNSCVCLYKAENGENKFGHIQIFHIEYRIAVITPFSTTCTLLSSLRKSRHKKVAEDTEKICATNSIFNVVTEDKNTFIAIPLENIIDICILLQIERDQSTIIVTSPNEFEFH